MRSLHVSPKSGLPVKAKAIGDVNTVESLSWLGRPDLPCDSLVFDLLVLGEEEGFAEDD